MIKTITIYYIDNKNYGNIILQQANHQATLETKNSQPKSSLHTFRVMLRVSKRAFCEHIRTLHSLYFAVTTRLQVSLRYLSCSHVLSIFLLACCWIEHYVINGLYQLQLYHTLDQEASKQFLV